MTKRKTQFPCGHRGHGRFCHHCATVAQAAPSEEPLLLTLHPASTQPNMILLSQAMFKQSQDVQNTPRSVPDPISLDGLPMSVVRRCREIFSHLESSFNYNQQLRGKRLRFDRTVISIPLPQYYRLLCRDLSGTIKPLKVVSHQEYNKIVRNAAIKLG